ncbi:hypothetical protein F0344_10950 [Streptomyces finlayi]|uniref:Uncharacterized protein n=1 Tax=Streptomyces finlayi TaxID=67296 RepID=A0A7G7BI94_9ACTN|nr:hypothetical protein [Streptomyces finlayi]QNE75059.1 hypothetical protein F0344_10950 [Streptomyces finlayi]
MNSATYVAAPLLAGFSVASIGLILTSQESFRWPGVTLLLLTLSAILLVTSVQFGITYQKYYYSLADVQSWWTDEEIESNEKVIAREQADDFAEWRKAAWGAMACYNMGITLLAASLATSLAPLPGDDSALESLKWTCVAILGQASLIAVIFGVSTAYKIHRVIRE